MIIYGPYMIIYGSHMIKYARKAKPWDGAVAREKSVGGMEHARAVLGLSCARGRRPRAKLNLGTERSSHGACIWKQTAWMAESDRLNFLPSRDEIN